MDFERYLGQLQAHAAAFVTAARTADPVAPIASCPGWTVRHLVEHLAAVHRWAANRCRTPVDTAPAPKPEPPSDFSELLDWATEGADVLADTMRSLGPDHPCSVFRGASPQTVAFWARRQAHETAIHRLDLELAGGGAPGPMFDPEFAADGVDELLASILPAIAPGRTSLGIAGSALVHAADAERAWLLRIAADGAVRVAAPDTAATDVDVTVAGTADAVYRAVWNRPSGAVVTGDARVLEPLAAP